eukprot:1311587-Prymnesium_polylepis.1
MWLHRQLHRRQLHSAVPPARRLASSASLVAWVRWLAAVHRACSAAGTFTPHRFAPVVHVLRVVPFFSVFVCASACWMPPVSVPLPHWALAAYNSGYTATVQLYSAVHGIL